MKEEKNIRRQFVVCCQNKKSKNKILVIFIVMVFSVFLYGCYNTYSQANTGVSEKLTFGIDSILSEIEIIDVKYKEVIYFEDYSKIYYIEPENWGFYGLQLSNKLMAETHLQQLELEEDEQIVFIKTYDYQVCYYIEEIIYTISSKDIVRRYVALIDREGGYIGASAYEIFSQGNNVDRLKERVECEIDDRGFLGDPISYVPRFYIKDLNEDGKVDMYHSYADMFLWDEGEYRLCSQEEAVELLNANEEKDMQPKMQLESFQSEHTNIINKENGRITYLQFYDITNAEQINAQIRDVIEKKDKEKEGTIDISAHEVIYVGERYLVVHMYTHIPGDYTWQGEMICEDSRYLTFNLEEGTLVSFEDILGESYSREDLIALMWKAYEKKINEIPDQYSKEEFDSYYEYAFGLYDKAGDKGNPSMEEYVKCYFTDEGMIVTYSSRFTYGLGGLPIHYYLNEELDIISGNDTLELFCSWEEIYDEAEG